MRVAASLALHAFDADGDPLAKLRDLSQGQYLRWYLADLDAKTVLVEPAYFDRDYLSEFAAFYCTSAAGYENVCTRAHYFADVVDRVALERAVDGDDAERERLQKAYLGFVVIRPIPATPIGRTVLRAYVDRTPSLPRVVEPFRRYKANVAGLEFEVDGIAWQQQDAAVGACAYPLRHHRQRAEPSRVLSRDVRAGSPAARCARRLARSSRLRRFGAGVLSAVSAVLFPHNLEVSVDSEREIMKVAQRDRLGSLAVRSTCLAEGDVSRPLEQVVSLGADHGGRRRAHGQGLKPELHQTSHQRVRGDHARRTKRLGHVRRHLRQPLRETGLVDGRRLLGEDAFAPRRPMLGERDAHVALIDDPPVRGDATRPVEDVDPILALADLEPAPHQTPRCRVPIPTDVHVALASVTSDAMAMQRPFR